MKTAIKIGVAGFITLIVALIYTIPAQFAISKLPPNASLQIAGVEGTVWNGSAAQVVVKELSLGKVTWDSSPLSLFTAQLKSRFEFTQPELNGTGTIRIGLNSISLENTKIFAKSIAVQPMLNTMIPSLTYTGTRLSGQMDLDLQEFKANRQGPQALQGTLLWQTAGFSEPMPVLLGNINAVLNYKDDSAVVDISNNDDGVLDIRGNARMAQGWNYFTDLLVSPKPDTPDFINRSLPFVGQTDRNGAVRIQQNGILAVN